MGPIWLHFYSIGCDWLKNELNSTQLNSTQLNSTQLNSTQLNDDYLSHRLFVKQFAQDPSTLLRAGGSFLRAVIYKNSLADGLPPAFCHERMGV
ncbi:hypothetical protein lacNasYZ03_10700 [Lactobacillus nasalidis]|uniref:Uncharacterized protein n=1 Tax=Lactobacillus nasalidis TaxID=2797258 RepID=A0ABQ3W4E2_9LACO|nr:hypothetical protein lacNasYZ03_10700 [Lactobacillus nasalidis]